MYCSYCDKEVETDIKKIVETYEVRGENITINANVCFCKECGEDLFHEEYDNDNLKRAYDEYRRKHNLLSASEIAKIRHGYNMTKEAFSRVLGFSDGKIKSLENGSLPTFSENNLLCLAGHPDMFFILLERGKNLINKEDYNAAKFEIEEFWAQRRNSV